MLKTIKQNILQWWNELDKKYFLGMLLFSSFVFFPLVSQRLTNAYDGMWTTAEYRAGGWELSNGRWLWPVFSFLRFSLQLEPINAVVCLMLVSLGVTRLHMLFKPVWMRTSCIDWLAGLCYVSNVVVGCYLSFHFIAPEYGFSLFFAMLATEHVIRGKSAVSSIVPAAVLLALSLGLYQTNLACFCLVLLAYFLLLLFRNGEKQKIREHICKSLASAASGAVLYLLILKAVLWATGTVMADYQGGADISVSGILKNLPSSVAKCYELFLSVFLWHPCKTQYAAGNCSCICFDFLCGGCRACVQAGSAHTPERLGKHFLWHSGAAGAAHDVHGIYGGNLAGIVLYSHVRRSGLVPAGLFLAIGQQPGGRNSL